MMGCVILLGVFALSVRRGWQTVLIVGVQLRQQGAVLLSKNFQGLVLAKNIRRISGRKNNNLIYNF